MRFVPRMRHLVATGVVCATSLALMQGAVAAPIGFDGIYRGTSTLTRGDDPPCGKTPAPATLSVVNGQFNLVWDAVRHFGVNLVVQQDGSFSGSQTYMPTARAQPSQLKVTGRITGNTLDAHVEGQACARDYHLTKG